EDRRGAGAARLPWQHPRRASAAAGGDGRAAATDGGDAAGRDVQPWAADGAEADQGGDRAAVRAALRGPGEHQVGERQATMRAGPWVQSASRSASGAVSARPSSATRRT